MRWAVCLLLICNFNAILVEHPFHIWLERSGGFIGIPTQVEVDSRSLSTEEAETLWQLIEDSGFFEANKNDSIPEGLPDQFQYKITIERGGNNLKVALSQASIPDNLRPLINYLTQKARSQKNK
jgi:hypothetical protein